ncbi:copper homeostasis protein cutc [Phlyctema vagabunda]|uniref:Copper homeostasis protein cutC homolog n=1 Tax=Phlyctema vagabunda TaxID=108571 RepID=A0ABR4PI94_9HELO
MVSYLEIACFNPASVRIAASSGADRIEFCAEASVGGVTPSLDEFITLRSQIELPIYVMIRPRGGSFTYTAAELAEMKQDLESFRDAGADGFVFGILLPPPPQDSGGSDGRVDVARCTELVALAAGKSCTFHRAFDELRSHDDDDDEMRLALRQITDCGFANLLTSGGATTALGGTAQLAGLVAQSRSVPQPGLEIVVGGGVRSGNAQELRHRTGARWFHSSAVVDGGDTASKEEVEALRRVLDRGSWA